MLPPKIRATRQCQLFHLELVHALEEAQAVAIMNPPMYGHVLFHSFESSLQGGSFETLVYNIEYVLLPSIAESNDPDWIQLGLEVQSFLQVLKKMNSTPLYGCDRCY